MSTKITLATMGQYDEIHLFNECFDDKHVYLSIELAATNGDILGNVTVRFTLANWDKLRACDGRQGPFDVKGG